jgi:two-component system alkaline phosphatase synthesis response regulator PhoP
MAHKILVIDDEKDLRDALRIKLETSGYTVIDAINGEDGLVKAESERPDLILLDIMMPKMDGHRVLNRIRQLPWGLHVHVLLLTNADDPLNITKGVELHSNDYIIKSQTSLEDIVKKVKQHLAGYHS